MSFQTCMTFTVEIKEHKDIYQYIYFCDPQKKVKSYRCNMSFSCKNKLFTPMFTHFEQCIYIDSSVG